MNQIVCDLTNRNCKPCEGGVPPLSAGEIATFLEQLKGWSHENGVITKTYTFKNYWQTMAFVNAAAWISHREDHHPVLTVQYNTCKVDYWTHAINGLSENDFICAAKIDALFSL
jgi:4a-hydroxytetrahydrobiopterin dehydratase